MLKTIIFGISFPLVTFAIKAEENSHDWVEAALIKSGLLPLHPTLISLIIVIGIVGMVKYFMRR